MKARDVEKCPGMDSQIPDYQLIVRKNCQMLVKAQ